VKRKAQNEKDLEVAVVWQDAVCKEEGCTYSTSWRVFSNCCSDWDEVLSSNETHDSVLRSLPEI